MEDWWRYWQGDLSQCHFATTDATRNYLGSSPDICGERPETNCLNNGMAHMGRSSFSTEGTVTSTQHMHGPSLTTAACKGVTGRSHKVLGWKHGLSRPTERPG